MRDEGPGPSQDTSPAHVGRPSSDNDDDDGPPSAVGKTGKRPHVFYCDLCGNVMLDLHCKLICERCGYKRDCSDP